MPVKTALAAIARNLKASLTRNVVQVQDLGSGCFILLEIKTSRGGNSVDELSLNAGQLADKAVHFSLRETQIEHLYANWKTTGVVSLFFTQGDHFTLINVSSHAKVSMLVGMDGRRSETPEEAVAQSNKRRIFYHLGSLEGAS